MSLDSDFPDGAAAGTLLVGIKPVGDFMVAFVIGEKDLRAPLASVPKAVHDMPGAAEAFEKFASELGCALCRAVGLTPSGVEAFRGEDATKQVKAAQDKLRRGPLNG